MTNCSLMENPNYCSPALIVSVTIVLAKTKLAINTIQSTDTAPSLSDKKSRRLTRILPHFEMQDAAAIPHLFDVQTQGTLTKMYFSIVYISEYLEIYTRLG